MLTSHTESDSVKLQLDACILRFVQDVTEEQDEIYDLQSNEVR